MKKEYFKAVQGAPKPISAKIDRVVRFEEVDPLGIVWHGRYPSFFEDAREALGSKYGLGYMDFYNNKVIAPIKKIHIDYIKPLRLKEKFEIESLLHFSFSTKLNFEFIIRNEKKEITTKGYTVQLMLDENQNLFLEHPPFYQVICNKWLAQKI